MTWTWPIGVFHPPLLPRWTQDLGSDQLGPRARAQATIKGKRSSGSAGRDGASEASLQQWEGREVSLGRLVTFLLPSGQRRRLENEGAPEARGGECRLLLWSRSST